MKRRIGEVMVDRPKPMSRADVAKEIGVTPDTISAYLRDGLIPVPDGHVGKSPWWWPETIREWRESRPGRGRRKLP